ncbi:diaminobutyrate--2-oxoglutarate transaminase [Salinisphaera hydrothermalis]|uniref:diaminobutyrate--2-oxoglutarate transaminase n=1 Tax=Salinisphaera hydrothermalis TaxID=563188 RepID=UPI00333E74BC
MEIINRLESEVRGYVRSFPKVFTHAKANKMTTEDGAEYLDFFSGAGALNYGHNDEVMKKALLDYIASDGVTHGLDMATDAKQQFLATFEDVIMKPRNMEYKIQFPGPTGTNAVEAALKIARKVKKRDRVLFFTNAYHGMTLGALAVTGNASKRGGAGVNMPGATPIPYSGYFGEGRDTADDLDMMLSNSSSGLEKPAAIILETVQGEGGINVADFDWLKKIEALCRKHDMLLIVDDIQAGVGRTGPFFSFEPAGISPDIITVSKSLSGYGLPLAITMIKPEYDIWAPGEHNGTFRGNNHAFITAMTALNEYWRDDKLEKSVLRMSDRIQERLNGILSANPAFKAEVRGRGFFIGIDCEQAELADEIAAECFKNHLICETAGPDDNVIKVMPPLISPDADIEAGLDILETAIKTVLDKHGLLNNAA